LEEARQIPVYESALIVTTGPPELNPEP
jgi:hypothetical protein